MKTINNGSCIGIACFGKIYVPPIYNEIVIFEHHATFLPKQTFGIRITYRYEISESFVKLLKEELAYSNRSEYFYVPYIPLTITLYDGEN